jgi:LuxR family transcriptional regulator, maltose regulon positive regulatory protein
MSLPILQTKLYVPRHQRPKNVVSRPHLTQKLLAGLLGKVTLISAPAGFGKSTLLSEWIAALRLNPAAAPALTPPISYQVTWLTLDDDDNDLVRFLLYLIASLQKFDSTIGETAWPLLQSPQPPTPKAILTILLNDLSLVAPKGSQARPRDVLVLEDYHTITTQSIHEAVTFFIDHLPPHLHVILTTRADPPLPFPRWRVRDQLAEIRAADLRFTLDEAAAFLNDRMDLHLSGDEVRALETRTEGWIAGLQLVALSLQGHANKADFLQTFSGSHRYILNYLVEEVLNQQRQAVQDFLLRTSILDRLCGPLCDAILAPWPLIPEHAAVVEWPAANDASSRTPDSSQAILEQLHQANLFLTPLDDEGQWYRYHPLFAEVLQHRLHQTQPQIAPQLHGQASVWYEQQGLLADAIHHALRAADFSRTAELIEQSWPATWNQGAVATLLNWVRALPQETLLARPSLAISYAWALALASQIGAAEECLHQVEAALQAVGPEAGAGPPARNTWLGRIAALRAMMAARRGEPEPAVQLAQQALRLLPSDAALLRGNACYALGLAYQQQGTLPAALQAYQAATKLGVATDEQFLTVAARYHQGRIGMAQGQLRMAATSYQQILAAAAQQAKAVPVVGLAHVGYAEILYEWNDLATAALHIETGMALSPTGSLTYTDGPLHRFLTLARIRQALGDRDGVLAAVASALDAARQTGIALDAERAAALKALLSLRLGQAEAAKQWAQRYSQSVTDEERFPYVHEFERLVFVRVLLAQSRASEALSLLAHWLSVAEAAQRMGSVIELSLLQAQALQLNGQPVAAMHTVAQALALAEPEGYVRLFVDEGEPLRLLLLALGVWMARQPPDEQQQRTAVYIGKLLEAFGPAPIPPISLTAQDHPSLPNPTTQVQTLIEPLTARELEVLRLMATGLSNAAIAERLVVTVGTVKSHLKHIYGKLGVQSRTQAVAQARQRGLL